MQNNMSKKIGFLALLVSVSALAAGRIQNEDVKSQTDIQAAAGTITGNLSSGSPCIASPSSILNLSAGLYAYNSTHSSYIPSSTTIVGIGTSPCTSGQIKLSANAAGTATGDTITFGGTASQLINDSKIWVTGSSQTLSAWIAGGGGGVSALNIATKTTDFTLTNSNDVLAFNCASACTLTLSSAATATIKPYRIKNIGTAQVTIVRAGSDLIDSDTSVILPPNGYPQSAVELIPSGGTAWYIF